MEERSTYTPDYTPDTLVPGTFFETSRLEVVAYLSLKGMVAANHRIQLTGSGKPIVYFQFANRNLAQQHYDELVQRSECWKYWQSYETARHLAQAQIELQGYARQR